MTHKRSLCRTAYPIVLLVAAMVVAACSADEPAIDEQPAAEEAPVVDPEPEPEPEPESPDVEQPTDEPGTGDTGDAHANRLEVFYVRAHDDYIWVEPSVVWVQGAADQAVLHAFEALFGALPDDPALGTAVPDGIDVLSVRRDGDVLIVDVDAAMSATSGGSAQELALAEQLAHTAAALDSVSRVRLTIDGRTIDELWGHLDWSQPLAPDPFSLTPITIEQPGFNINVSAGQVEVSGQATVFEAQFMLRLYDAGLVAEEVPVMASAGAPERGTWSHTFTITTPGEYYVEAEEFDASDGEGRLPLIVGRHVTVVAP